jgi:outer membrane lipoprotein
MKTAAIKHTALSLLCACTLNACVSMPTPLQGQFSVLLPAESGERNASGERVRWGGTIVKVDTHSDHSCFEIVGTQTGSDGRPERLDKSEGRFIACRKGFYDPEVFSAGRELTVTGSITGFESRKIGDYDYRYPQVAAEVVYLWPVRQDTRVIVEHVPYFW